MKVTIVKGPKFEESKKKAQEKLYHVLMEQAKKPIRKIS